MIDAQDVVKVFAGRGYRVEALRGVSVKAERGRITALVGPNGAGKTTLIKVIATLILPTSGRVYVDGLDAVSQAREVRRRIGLVTVSERLLYYRLTGLENLMFYGALYDMSVSEARRRALELLQEVGLYEWANQPTMHYSTGMLRRLAIARSLMHSPDVLLLDEPTLGIDTTSSRRVRQLVRRLAEGRTVVLTSHFMKEIEELADMIYVIKEGRILARGTPDEIKALAGRFVEAKVPVNMISQEVEKYVVRYENGAALVRGPEELIAPVAVESRPTEPSLEDAYIKLVGESTADFRPYQIRRGGAWGRERPV